VAAILLGFPIFVRGWICRRQRDPQAIWPEGYVITFAIFWFLAEAVGVVMQRRMYAYHFLPIIPPAALIFGLIPRASRPIPLGAALLPIAFLSIYAAADVIAFSYRDENRMPESQYLALHTKPGDAVWIDSWPRLVLETNLRPGSRYPMTFLFTNYDTAGLDYANGMIADFERIKPAYIFLPAQMDRQIRGQVGYVAELMRRPLRRENYATGWHRIEAYTLAHYDKESMVGDQTVYHRRPEVPATADVRGE
jgi:4-amino-4-deoxy-L-arabinose transferase-like glycosyltransferase